MVYQAEESKKTDCKPILSVSHQFHVMSYFVWSSFKIIHCKFQMSRGSGDESIFFRTNISFSLITYTRKYDHKYPKWLSAIRRDPDNLIYFKTTNLSTVFQTGSYTLAVSILILTRRLQRSLGKISEPTKCIYSESELTQETL